MPYWAVAQTEHQRETVAQKFLSQANFETYLPKIQTKIAARSRIVPLFPSYIFVRIASHWYTIRWTVGIIRLIMSDDHPAVVGDKVISTIQKREGENGLVKLPKKPGLQRGQNVRIIRGSFAERIGVFDGMLERDRVRVLIELLGRSVPVTLPPQDIQSVTQTPS